MLTFNCKITRSQQVEHRLILTYDLRQKSRFKAQTDNGQAVTVSLPRGTQLKNGDILQTESGEAAAIIAAPEEVSVAHSIDPLQLMRVCYHLGNRHVPLQIESNMICYQADHVLDAMVVGLGLIIVPETRCFEPESGAYSHH